MGFDNALYHSSVFTNTFRWNGHFVLSSIIAEFATCSTEYFIRSSLDLFL